MLVLVRRCAAMLAFTLAFVVNPFYVVGCASDDEEERQRAARAEMRLLDMLDDINGQASFAFEQDGERYELLLELSQAKGEIESARAPGPMSVMNVAHACGQRTFYQSASACDTQYMLAVEGSFTLRRLGDSPKTIASDVAVSGLMNDDGSLGLQLAGSGNLRFFRSAEDRYVLDRLIASDLGGESFDAEGDRD